MRLRSRGVPVPPPSRCSAGAGGTGAGLRAGAGRAAREGLGETGRHCGQRGRGLRDGTKRARRGLRGGGGRRARCFRAQARGPGGCGNGAAAGGGGAPGGGRGRRGSGGRRRGSGRATRTRGGRGAALEQLQHALQLPAELRNLAVEVGDLQRGRKAVSPDGAGGPRTPGRPRTSRLSRTMLRSAASTSAASAGPRSAVPAEKTPHVAGIPSLPLYPLPPPHHLARPYLMAGSPWARPAAEGPRRSRRFAPPGYPRRLRFRPPLCGGAVRNPTSSSPYPPPPPPGHVQPSALPGAELEGSRGVQGGAEETSRPPAPAAPHLPSGPRRGDAALVSARSAGESRGAATWGQQRFAGGDGGGRSLEDLIRLFLVFCDAGEGLLRAGAAVRAGLRVWAEGSALLPAPRGSPHPTARTCDACERRGERAKRPSP